MKDDKYMLILAGYIRSIFQDFESYLRTEIDLVEDYIRLVSDEHNASFITLNTTRSLQLYRSLRSSFENSSN